MKKVIIPALLLALAGASQAAEPYIGKFLYKYHGGNTYRVTVPDEKSLKWECVVGDEKGATGTEQPTRIKVAEDIYFVSWVEKTGIAVTQVVNFKDKKVISTVVVGGQRYVLEGSVEKE